jgi:oligoribonuclease
MPKKAADPRLVFLDLETTGLEPEQDAILEIGMVVCDIRESFAPLAEWSVPVKTKPATLAMMSDFVRGMHQMSGVLVALEGGVSLREAESAAAHFLNEQNFTYGTVTMAGYGPHFDRAFLKKHMPTLHNFFDYRMVDVSTLRGLVRRLVDPDIDSHIAPVLAGYQKHRAISDCYAACDELAFYSKYLFDVDGLRKAMMEIL